MVATPHTFGWNVHVYGKEEFMTSQNYQKSESKTQKEVESYYTAYISESYQRIWEEPHGSEVDEDSRREENFRFLEQAIALRQGRIEGNKCRYSSMYLLEVAAERYFKLLSYELSSLDGRFTEDELRLALSAVQGLGRAWFSPKSLANMFAEDNGLESLEGSSPLVALTKKLGELTHLQNAALQDVCERFFVTEMEDGESFRSVISRLGLELAM